jgi:hypothetical protein
MNQVERSAFAVAQKLNKVYQPGGKSPHETIPMNRAWQRPMPNDKQTATKKPSRESNTLLLLKRQNPRCMAEGLPLNSCEINGRIN